MRSMNRAMLMGHLAADTELRQTKSGHTMATFSVVTNRLTRNEEGEKKETADFHRVVVWQKLAEICAKYLVKGMAVFVEGHIVYRTFDDKEGRRHYRTEIVADEVNIITSKKQRELAEAAAAVEGKGVEITETAEDRELVAA